MKRTYATCPNCEARMNSSEDPCPECDHNGGDPGCQCQHCEYVYAAEREEAAQQDELQGGA